MTDEQETNHAFARSRSNAGLGGIDCQACGACCAYSETWPELLDDPDGEGIPIEMIDCDAGRMRCNGNRCCALEGEIGVSVRCAVYAHRPYVCREFSPELRRDDCDKVRAWSGLPPMPPNAAVHRRGHDSNE